MEFLDLTSAPPQLAQPKAASPYRAEPHPFTAVTGGEVRTRLVKVRASGHRETMADDEIEIWKRVQWFEAAAETALTAPSITTEEPPPLPYTVQMLPYGTGVMRPTKVPSQGWGGELLTPDEIATWEYLHSLEEKFEALRTTSPTPNSDLLEISAEVKNSDDESNNSDCPANGPMATNPGDAPVSNLPKVEDSTAVMVAPRQFVEVTKIKPFGVGGDLLVSEHPETSPTGTKADNLLISNEKQPEDYATDATELDTANRRAAVRQQVESELLADPSRPNGTIAAIANCSDELVRLIRKALIGDGRLQNTPIIRRDGSSYAREVGPATASDGS